MKRIRIFAALIGFVLAIGASLAFRPMPTITGYQFIAGTHPQCLSKDNLDCGHGNNTCVVGGITYRRDNDPLNSCGPVLSMP